MESSEIRSYAASVADHIVDSSIDEWRIRTADGGFLVAVVETLQTAERAGLHVNWLVDAETLKRLQNDFLIATKMSELTATDQLSIRTSTDKSTTPPTVMISETSTVSFLPLSEGEAVETVHTDETVTERVWEKYETEWEMGIPESIDTPPYSRLLSLAASKLGADASVDIDDAYEAIERQEPPEPVVVGLLIGAKRELLLRDIVEWAETATLATQGTVSKLKQRLEDVGVITTESENIGVGRPRQRLILDDDSYVGLGADELVSTVQSALSS